MEINLGAVDAWESKSLGVEELPSVQSYLTSDAVRNLIFIGFLQAGLTTQAPYGTFYGFWKNGVLRGVGLLGDAAAWAGGVEIAQVLGEKARDSEDCQFNLLVGLAPEVNTFIETSHDKRRGKTEEYLFYLLRRGELNSYDEDHIALSPACPESFEELFRIHSDLFVELAGRPLSRPEISAQQLLRRIEEGRVWIHSEDDRILFKADVTSKTNEAVLIEAIWTHPDSRGRGIGRNALSALCSQLLITYPMVCLSFREDQPRLQAFYEGIGFKHHRDLGDYILVRY